MTDHHHREPAEEEYLPDQAWVEQQNRRENEFLRMISEGRAEDALQIYAQTETEIREEYIGAAAAPMRRSVAYATIVRTLARKAAEQGGVPPMLLSTISARYEQKMYAAANNEELRAMIPVMIREYCELVRTVQSEHYSPPVRSAVHNIQRNYAAPLTAAQLADEAGVSPNYLSSVFRRETGMTISQFLACQRCRKAASLLRGSALPIQEISRSVGYMDSNYFVKVFRRYYHMTPGEYRRDFYKM